MLIDEFSYASPDYSLPRNLLIRSIEMLSGQPQLKRIYMDYRKDKLPHSVFWGEVVRRLNVDLQFAGNRPESVPKTGSLVIVANHPYGVLDGIAICWLVAQQRSDFKILINSVLCRADEMAPHVLPVDFEPTEKALAINLASRRAAREWLAQGGAVIIFPAGAISTTPKLLKKQAIDEPWAPLVGQLVRRAKAPVLPVFFDGQNSALFQWASHLSYDLRAALIFHEVHRRMNSTLRLAIGDVLPFDELEGHLPAANLAHYLQNHTLGLQSHLLSSADKM